MRVQGTGVDPAALPAEASLRARTVAEQQAKASVDRCGRQRIEERQAEVLIRNIRTQRNRARQARQQQRDSAAQQQAAERALQLARQATGRGGGADSPGLAAAGGGAACCAAPHAAAAPTSPFAFGSSSGGEAEPPLATAGGGDNALARPLSSSRRCGDHGCSRAMSSPAALPVSAALLPGGRVTLGNLHSLLAGPQASVDADGSSAAGELGSAAAAAPEGRAGGAHAAPAPARRLSVAELSAMLSKHAKLD
jgi:hypothetical protein